jgi:Carboxypeptidase regulatory-like domain
MVTWRIVSVFGSTRARALAALSLGIMWAQEPPLAHADVGDTTDALPGIVQVPVAGAIERTGVAVAASAGYGFTESVLHEGDAHHRASGSLAATVRPIPLLAVGLRLDGRYDAHTGPETGSGWIGDPRLELRLGGPVGHGWNLGAQVGVWLPGDAAPSWVLAATTPDASLLASYSAPGSRITVATRAGFRWDNSAKGAPDADRLSRPDRLSLGLDQASAALLGLGLVARVAPRVEVLADVTWDLLVGNDAPTALESPIVASAGARIGLGGDGRWQAMVVASASPSERPAIGVGSPLVDVEPLVSGFVALSFRPGLPPEPVLAQLPVAPPAPEPAPVATPVSPPPPPAHVRLQGHVVAKDANAPVVGAHVTVTPSNGPPRETITAADGSYAVDDLDPGEVSLAVTAEGFAPSTRTVSLHPGATTDLDAPMPKALPVGQVRGLVRDFAGAPVAASIRIEPLGLDVHVGRDGTFQADVAPGKYEVVVHARGFVDQKRRVVVERDGVTMLNLELRKGR